MTQLLISSKWNFFTKNRKRLYVLGSPRGICHYSIYYRSWTYSLTRDGEYLFGAAGLSTMLRKSSLHFSPAATSSLSFSFIPTPPPLISVFPLPFIFCPCTRSECYSKWETVCWWPSCWEQQVLVHCVCCVHSSLYTRWVLLYEAGTTNSYVNELLTISRYES